MYPVLVASVIGLFVAMLFLQLYFRIKVLKIYKRLIGNRVQFTIHDVFNLDKRRAVQVNYPDSAEDIESFATYLRRAIRMATILLVLITIFGAILMYYR